MTKRDAEQVAGWLNQKGITARAYYSGVETQDELNSEADSDRYRQHLESLLYNNEVKALVATTALGSSMP